MTVVSLYCKLDYLVLSGVGLQDQDYCFLMSLNFPNDC